MPYKFLCHLKALRGWEFLNMMKPWVKGCQEVPRLEPPPSEYFYSKRNNEKPNRKGSN